MADLAKPMEDAQKLGQAGVDTSMKMWSHWTKGWQAMAAEMSDYSKRSFEDGTQTLEKLMTARSLEQVIEIQTSYSKRWYDDYVQQMTRLGSMYADIAKDTTKPLERLTSKRM